MPLPRIGFLGRLTQIQGFVEVQGLHQLWLACIQMLLVASYITHICCAHLLSFRVGEGGFGPSILGHSRFGWDWDWDVLTIDWIFRIFLEVNTYHTRKNVNLPGKLSFYNFLLNIYSYKILLIQLNLSILNILVKFSYINLFQKLLY